MTDFVYSYDWYDGPRSGVADYKGQPYYFESQWADIDSNLEDWFKLSAIAQEVFEQESERWQLWAEYLVANSKGLVGSEHHPYLPSARSRGEELERILQKELVINETSCLVALAEFTPLNEQMHPARPAEMAVRWTVIPVSPSASRKAEIDFWKLFRK